MEELSLSRKATETVIRRLLLLLIEDWESRLLDTDKPAENRLPHFLVDLEEEDSLLDHPPAISKRLGAPYVLEIAQKKNKFRITTEETRQLVTVIQELLLLEVKSIIP